MKVFWSWQSDTPGKIGRHFVRDALSAAIERLKQTPEIEEPPPAAREARSALHLDHDRKGIPGSPDLARMILEKIIQCAVFVADVTSVGITTTQTDETQRKKIINPNVAIELGYALHALGDRAFLMVMNEHYGSRTDLPFDLQSKAGPIMFRLSPDADRKTIAAASRQLTAQLAEALELCITQHVESIRHQTPFPEAEASYTPAAYFEPNEVLATAGDPGEQEYRVNGERLVYLRLFPTRSGQPSVGLTKLTHVFETRRPCPMSMAIGGMPSRNRWGPVIYDPGVSPRTIVGVTQGFPTGELWGVNAQMFSLRGRHNVSGADIWLLSAIGLEKLYVRALRNYVKVASSELALILPYTVEMGAVGINGAYLAVPGGDLNTGRSVGPIMKPYIHERYSIAEISGRILKTTGDGALIEFSSVVGAVECAVALQELMVERNTGIPGGRQGCPGKVFSPA
jgi:hypothetical protein